MVAAGSRASTRVVGTRAIKTSAGTTGSTRVGTPLTGISTSTSASPGTRASTGSRVGTGTTGTGSRAIGKLTTSALVAGRRATGGKAVPVPGSAVTIGTGSHAIGTPAKATGTSPASHDGVIPSSLISAGRTTTAVCSAAGARIVTCPRTVASPRTVTCPCAVACATAGEGVIAPASARRSAPGSGTVDCPAPTAIRAAGSLPRTGVRRATAPCAARERGRAAPRSTGAGGRTTEQSVGRK
ncbi:hypothetical protein GCM10010116_26230 [Microbispora rosea subsp. aerata]|nr:hypothetical protein GCM10010116_26230 [Microbispora rosea subsp. aerata]GIH58431.1 hypothetical protein Mro02_53450 [Microbispora rosea subsp. aerata]GLJ85159.1 hypothetical protein GCM10017588_38870 [Microbispora rosea subsp. aerata]